MTESPTTPCRWCGLTWHGPACPRVAAMEFHPDGTIKRVEFIKLPSVSAVDSLVPDGRGGWRLSGDFGGGTTV